MGVLVDISGQMLGCDFQPAEAGDGPGFFSVTVLPNGSREVLRIWAFGDNLAARHLSDRYDEEGVCEVALSVDIRPKVNQAGHPTLSVGLKSAVDLDGEVIRGRAEKSAA